MPLPPGNEMIHNATARADLDRAISFCRDVASRLAGTDSDRYREAADLLTVARTAPEGIAADLITIANRRLAAA